MKTKILQGIAIILMIQIGLFHYFSSQHEFEEAWILGYLFIFNFVGTLLAAYAIYRQKAWGWGLGLLIALGSMGAYIWSRTTGLPGLRPENWFDPWGISSLFAEVLFCLVALVYAIQARHFVSYPQAQLAKTVRTLYTSGTLAVLILVNVSVNHWEAQIPDAEHGHVFFLWQVRLQPQVSIDTLAQDYGLEAPRIASSMMDSIVDVRLKVVDPEKARKLLDTGAFALLVGNTLIPAPHIHRHMLNNHTVILFFPNLQQAVSSGTQVSLVFDSLRVEPVTAR